VLQGKQKEEYIQGHSLQVILDHYSVYNKKNENNKEINIEI
jgi:hypothetical protein